MGIFFSVITGSLFSRFITPANPDQITVMLLAILLFFIQGFKLPTENIIQGLSNYKLHIFTQSCIFIIYPVYFYILMKIFSPFIDSRLIIGIYALSTLPTSVSSCTVFTASAGGNVSATMFNAAFSNIAGVFISPLLISLLLSRTGQSLPLDEVIRILISLFIKMILPITAGQITRQYVKKFAEKNKNKMHILSNIIVLSILLFAIASSRTMLTSKNIKIMILPVILIFFSYPFMLFILSAAGKAAGFNKADRISALFAGSKKTLAMGMPLLATYFASKPELIGWAIMPVLFYQPYQLIVCAILLKQIGKG